MGGCRGWLSGVRGGAVVGRRSERPPRPPRAGPQPPCAHTLHFLRTGCLGWEGSVARTRKGVIPWTAGQILARWASEGSRGPAGIGFGGVSVRNSAVSYAFGWL